MQPVVIILSHTLKGVQLGEQQTRLLKSEDELKCTKESLEEAMCKVCHLSGLTKIGNKTNIVTSYELKRIKH